MSKSKLLVSLSLCSILAPHVIEFQCFKNEEKLLERLDRSILDVIDNPDKTQKTTNIGTLF